MQQILYIYIYIYIYKIICDSYSGKALRKNTVKHFEMWGIKIFPI